MKLLPIKYSKELDFFKLISLGIFMEYNQLDPKKLIAESYKIAGITASECRSIFLDWALSIPLDCDSRLMALELFDHYHQLDKEHPMTLLLKSSSNKTKGRTRVGRRRN